MWATILKEIIAALTLLLKDGAVYLYKAIANKVKKDKRHKENEQAGQKVEDAKTKKDIIDSANQLP